MTFFILVVEPYILHNTYFIDIITSYLHYQDAIDYCKYVVLMENGDVTVT